MQSNHILSRFVLSRALFRFVAPARSCRARIKNAEPAMGVVDNGFHNAIRVT